MEAIHSIRKEVKVGGMSCASCANAVENVLKKQKGVEKASVSYANNSAQIEFDDEVVSPEFLRNVVSGIGYSLHFPDAENTEDEFEKSEAAALAKIKFKAYVAIALAIPVLILGMFFMDFTAVKWVLFGLTTVFIFYLGAQFFKNSYKQLRHGQTTMDTLVAMSTGVAYIYSSFVLFFPEQAMRLNLSDHVYFEAASIVIAFVLLGRLLEENARSGVGKAIRKLMALRSDFVLLVQDESLRKIRTEDVLKGDILSIRKGDSIPVDGNLEEDAWLDEQSITGEFGVKEKKAGDEVYSGSVNKGETFRMKATRVGEDSLLSGIIRTVKQAQSSKPPIQNYADNIARVFVPLIISIASLSFLAWYIWGGEAGFSQGLHAFVTVLVIACPCALGLATPTAIMAGMGRASQKGVLFKNASGLQTLGEIDTMVVDKTGTLTEGKPQLIKAVWYEGSQNEFGDIIASMESRSSHPLAQAILTYFSASKKSVIFQDTKEVEGMGMKASYFGKAYWLGSRKLALSMEVQENLLDADIHVFFGEKSRLIGGFVMDDIIKPSAGKAVKSLKEAGVEVIMATGDAVIPAENVARLVGIQKVYAGLLPTEKAGLLTSLKNQGKKLAMVGDGINDSEALALADVGIAMGHGSDIALDVAEVALVQGDLTKLAEARSFSKKVMKVIRENLFWAFLYNLIGVPIAMGLFHSWGIHISPMFASLAMSLSSVSVVLNSLRLTRA